MIGILRGRNDLQATSRRSNSVLMSLSSFCVPARPSGSRRTGQAPNSYSYLGRARLLRAVDRFYQ